MSLSKDNILTLINSYSFTLDSGDFDGFAKLFEHGEWIFEDSPPLRGAKELSDKLLSRVILYEGGTPRTRHVSTNIEIQVNATEDEATSRRYVTVTQQTDKLPLQVIYTGEYFDEYTKRDDGNWYFKRVTIRNPLYGDLSHHIK